MAVLHLPVLTITAQVKFTASVSAGQISKNEFVQLRLMVENANEVKQITPPRFKNFIVVSGPNSETGMTAANGAIRQYAALSFVLKPRGPGTYTIPAAVAIADGNEYRSNAVTVQVTNTLAADNSSNNNNSPFAGFNPFDDAPPQPAFNDYILKKGENAAEKINRNMFIRLETDKTSCYVGEPVIATYKLYTRLKSETNIVKYPSFNGFSVIDLQQPDNNSYTTEKINGRDYNVFIIRKVQLYPLQPGSFELGQVEIENNVHFIKEAYASGQNNNMNDMFREFAEAAIPAEGIVDQKATLKNNVVNITVKALPDTDVPAAFKGAVGNFAIEGLLDKNNFTTDDAGNLKVIIAGVGNLQLVNTPEIQWPQGVEGFEPAVADDFVRTTVPVSGRKIIDYPFTVAAPGNYILPAIKFCYFNAKEGKYKTDSTKPIAFTVVKGTGKKANPVITAGEKTFLNKFFSNRRWVVSTVAVLILCVLIFWLKRDRKLETEVNQNLAAEAAAKAEAQKIAEAIAIEEKNWLEKAGKLLQAGNSTAFYYELNLALKNYLSEKLHLPVETINKKNIAEAMDKKNIAVNTALQLQQVMNSIELKLYTPFTGDENETLLREEMQELYNSTAGIMELLGAYKT